MDHQHSLDHENTDELLALLADQHRRSTLAYFQESTDDVATLEELSTALNQRGHADEDDLWLQLHHSALPRLESAGVLEYDTGSNTVRYRGHPELEALVGFVADL